MDVRVERRAKRIIHSGESSDDILRVKNK